MKKLFILSTLCLILIQGIQAQQSKMDTMVNNVNLRLEKTYNDRCNGILTSVVGVGFMGIGFNSYREVERVDKTNPNYKNFERAYNNQAKLAKGMMIGGGLLTLVGGGVVITAQKKIKLNLLYREICLSLH